MLYTILSSHGLADAAADLGIGSIADLDDLVRRATDNPALFVEEFTRHACERYNASLEAALNEEYKRFEQEQERLEKAIGDLSDEMQSQSERDAHAYKELEDKVFALETERDALRERLAASTFSGDGNASSLPAVSLPAAPAAFQIDDYSERAIVLRGPTKPHTEALKALYGRYNSRLRGGPGWIFSRKRREAVEAFVESVQEADSKPAEVAQ